MKHIALENLERLELIKTQTYLFRFGLLFLLGDERDNERS